MIKTPSMFFNLKGRCYGRLVDSDVFTIERCYFLYDTWFTGENSILHSIEKNFHCNLTEVSINSLTQIISLLILFYIIIKYGVLIRVIAVLTKVITFI